FPSEPSRSLTTMSERPASLRLATTFDPMKPAPPVTNHIDPMFLAARGGHAPAMPPSSFAPTSGPVQPNPNGNEGVRAWGRMEATAWPRRPNSGHGRYGKCRESNEKMSSIGVMFSPQSSKHLPASKHI